MVLIRCPYLNQVTFLGSLMIYVCNQIKVNVILLMCLFCFTNYYFQYKNEKIPKKEKKRKENPQNRPNKNLEELRPPRKPLRSLSIIRFASRVSESLSFPGSLHFVRLVLIRPCVSSLHSLDHHRLYCSILLSCFVVVSIIVITINAICVRDLSSDKKTFAFFVHHQLQG